MSKPIRTIIADDHPVVVHGFELMFKNHKTLEIVGKASDGLQLTVLTRDLTPDLVFTDIQMPVMNGIEATREIKKTNPGTYVIAFTMFNDDHLILDMLDAGAEGYLLKNAKPDEIIEAAIAVTTGENYYSEATSLSLAKMIVEKRKWKQEQSQLAQLTHSEKQLILLLCEQYAIKEIAERTKFAFKTIQKYRSSIMRKIGARNMVGVVVYAIRTGLYKP